MKRLLTDGSLSTMRWFLFKVHRILENFLFIASLAVLLIATNLAGAQAYETEGECFQKAMNDCYARHQDSPRVFWGGCGSPNLPHCSSCGYVNEQNLWAVDPPQHCIPIYENPEANKVSEPQREHSCKVKASIIDIDNQIVGEDVAIVGTPFHLMYFSDRVFGRVNNYSIHIPIPFDDPSITQIAVAVTVAGRVFPSQSFNALPNQVYVLSWDGLDANNHQLPPVPLRQ